MNLYKSWFEKAYTEDGKIKSALWNDFMPREQKVYEHILKNKRRELKGTIKDLAKEFNMEPIYFIGFIDGINATQVTKVNMEELTEDSLVDLQIDFEILYKKMVEYKADHLYTLDAWKNIFSEDNLKLLYKSQRSSKTFVSETKIERNDPCPCGSGKKYKKCCGAN